MTKVWLSKSWRPTKSNPKRRCWLARWIGEDGKQCGETLGDCATMDKMEAKRQAQEKQAKFNLGLAPVDRPKRSGLEAFLSRDREACVKQRPRTLDEMKRAAAHAVAALGADADVTRLDESDAGRLFRHLRDRHLKDEHLKPLSDSTIVKVMRYVGAAFSRGVKRREVVRNPFKEFDLPEVRIGKVLYYSAVQVSALIAAAPDEWWRSLIRLAHETGLRQGELLNLQWSDLDGDLKVVTVSPKKAVTFEVGGREYSTVPWEAKDHDTRAVPLLPETIKTMRAFRRSRETPEDVFRGGSPYVFLSLADLDRLARYRASHAGRLPDKVVDNLTRSWARIVKAARVRMAEADKKAGVKDPREWTCGDFHGLRRSFATRLASEGCPPKVLQKLLGHSKIETTMRHYVADEDSARWVRSAFPLAAS